MSDDKHDYSNEPQSFTERRAIQERAASIMTPRDALIMALRELDAGTFDPDALIVVASVRNPDHSTDTAYYAASPHFYQTVGLLEAAKELILHPRKR